MYLDPFSGYTILPYGISFTPALWDTRRLKRQKQNKEWHTPLIDFESSIFISVILGNVMVLSLFFVGWLITYMNILQYTDLCQVKLGCISYKLLRIACINFCISRRSAFFFTNTPELQCDWKVHQVINMLPLPVHMCKSKYRKLID